MGNKIHDCVNGMGLHAVMQDLIQRLWNLTDNKDASSFVVAQRAYMLRTGRGCMFCICFAKPY